MVEVGVASTFGDFWVHCLLDMLEVLLVEEVEFRLSFLTLRLLNY